MMSPSLKKLLPSGNNSSKPTTRSSLILIWKSTEWKSSPKTSKLLRLIPLVLTVLPNSSTYPPKNSLLLTSPLRLRKTLKLFTMLSPTKILTGLLLERLPELRIKVNVVHAGLSLPLVPSNLQLFLLVKLPTPSTSLNNNWLIAPSKILVAMVV